MFSHPCYRPSLRSGHFKDLHAAPQRKSIKCLAKSSLEWSNRLNASQTMKYKIADIMSFPAMAAIENLHSLVVVLHFICSGKKNTKFVKTSSNIAKKNVW